MSTNCISGNIPQIWRLSGVTRTIRCVINDAEGEPRDLSDLTLAVVVSRDNTDFRFSPAFVIEGDDHNVVAFSWPADKQGVGDYTVEVTGVDGSGNVDRVNWHGATGIRLVDYTNEVRGDCPAIMSDEPAIGLEGQYTMNGTGMSAYDEWLAQGHTGTPEDFLAWLRQPATDAASAAEAQMSVIQGRADDDHRIATADHTTAGQDHTRAGNDHTTATDDHRIAAADHSTATDDHTLAASDHGTAAEDHRVAGIDHGTAGEDHTRAGQDHQTASDDHTQAGSDHTRAGEDHTRAGDDHQTASGDHTQAGQDHTQAGNDHTRAEADHGIAADDHTQAAQDHQQAVSDHETWADKADTDGYYERMGVGTAKNLEGVVSQSAEIIFRKTGGSASVDSGLATMSSIKGKSIVWNQMAKDYTQSSNLKATGSSSIQYDNGKIKINIADTSSNSAVGIATSQFIANHKIAILIQCTGTVPPIYKLGSWASVGDNGTTVNNGVSNTIRTIASEGRSAGCIWFWGSATSDFEISDINLFDLTLMFGAGNEPSTVEEFEAMYPLPYYDYNAGEIVSNKATALETVGFNQWDEEWENGRLLTTTGANYNNVNGIRSKNYIPVTPGTYYFKNGTGINYTITICRYDGAKNYVDYVTKTYRGGEFTVPAGVAYIRFYIPADSAVTAYNNNICISLSDPAKNGTYQPYEKHTLTLNLPTLTGKLNGEGTSVTIAPDGLKSAGTAYDYGVVENGYLTKIVKCVGDVDMGDLTWNNVDAANGRYYAVISDAKGYNDNTVCCVSPLYTYKYMSYETSYDMTMQLRTNQRLYLRNSAYTTASSFDTAMTGVPLYYQLAEPQTYVLDNPVYVGYLEDGGGTERRLPEDTASSVLAPLACDVTYPMDAVGAIEKMPENYISKESMQAYLAARASLDNGTWTMTWDAAAGKYNFSFTPNA